MMMVLMDILLNLKVNGKTVLYSFTSLFDSLPDGTLACKAANVFMLKK